LLCCFIFFGFTKQNQPYILFLVDAQNLDYSDAAALFCSIQKSPSKTVGHAWICLCKADGTVIEGGHSGEVGLTEPRYLESLLVHMNERNPARHLFKSLQDGYFEKGSGIHTPSYAIRLNISEEECEKICQLIGQYHFSRYSLTDNQCVHLVARIAGVLGLKLSYEVSVPIPQQIEFEGELLTLWHDSEFNSITLATPDELQKSMKKAVLEGQAIAALDFYKSGRVK
jgi:hypothetical protein